MDRNILRKTFVGLRDICVFGAILLPAPFYGGGDPRAEFGIRALVAAAFLLCLLSRPAFLASTIGELRFVLSLIAIFLALVWIQFALGPGLVLTWSPGTVYADATRRHATQLFFYFLFFLVCLDTFTSRQKVRLIALLLAIEVTLLIAFAYYLRINRSIGGIFETAPNLFFASNSNDFGAMLSLVTPLILGVTAYTIRRLCEDFEFGESLILATLYCVLVAVLTTAIYYSGARAVFIVHILAVPAFIYFSFDGPVRKIRWAAMAIFVILASTIFVYSASSVKIESRLTTLPADFIGRLKICLDSAQLLKDFPFFGSGLGTFPWIARRYQMIQPEIRFYKRSYSTYLGLTYETGLIGAVLLLAALAFFLYGAWKRVRGDRSTWAKSMGLAGSTLVVMTIVLLAVDNYLATPATALGVIAQGVIFYRITDLSGRPERLDDDVSVPTYPAGRPAALFSLLLVFLVPLFLFQSMQDFLAQRLVARNGSLFLFGIADPGKTRDVAALERAIQLNPGNAEAWALLGRALEDQVQKSRGPDLHQRLARPIEAYHNSTRLAPTWPDTWFRLGRLLILDRRRSEGLRAMEGAVINQPYNRDAYLYLITQALKWSEESPWPREREEAKRLALYWLERSKRLSRPFTREDYDYIGGFDSIHQRDRLLTPLEKRRFLSLIDQR